MELRRFVRCALFLHKSGVDRGGLWALSFLMSLCLLILGCSGQKEKEKSTASGAKRVTVQVEIPSKLPEKVTKRAKADEVNTTEAASTAGRYQGKEIPEDASGKEEAGKTLEGETPRVVDLVERVLRPDLSREERTAAVKELANLDHATILKVVMNALDSPSPDVREAALEALTEVDDEAVNTPLIKALEDDAPDVREKAMDVMGHIESPNILPTLERALADRDEDVREEALSVLEDIPDHRAVDILIEKGLQHENESIREETLDSLEFITDQRFESYEQAREWWDRNRDEFVFPKVWQIRKRW